MPLFLMRLDMDLIETSAEPQHRSRSVFKNGHSEDPGMAITANSLTETGTNGRIRDGDRERTSLQANAICNSSDGVAATDWLSAGSTRARHVNLRVGLLQVCSVCATRCKTRSDRTMEDLLEGEMTTCESEKRFAGTPSA
jgi:hypothetical protein